MALAQNPSFLTIAKRAVYFMSCASILFSYPQIAIAAESNKAKETLAIMEACVSLRQFDETAPQWFSDIRGEVTKKTDKSTVYASKASFPNASTSIVEYSNGQTVGMLNMGTGKTTEDIQKTYGAMKKLLETCFTSEVSRAQEKGKAPFISKDYLLSNGTCTSISAMNLGQGILTIQFWTPDSSNKACDALR